MANEDLGPDEQHGTPAAEESFRSGDWTRFPIVVDGVAATHVNTYSFEITPNVFIGIGDFADVVTRWTRFQPCDDVMATDKVNALDSFFYDDWVENYISTAAGKGLAVILPLPFVASPLATCDGSVTVGVNPDPDTLWTAGNIQVPMVDPDPNPALNWDDNDAKTQLTSGYNDYWGDKAEFFIDAVDSYDTRNAVWGWRVIEELRHWIPAEVAFALEVRDTVLASNGPRPMFAYTSGGYYPTAGILSTLVERDAPGVGNSLTYTFDPPDGIARENDDINKDVVVDHYPVDVTFARTVGHALIQMFDHVISGTYTESKLGTDGHECRTWTYHRSRMGREALDNLEELYDDNAMTEGIVQSIPEHILFHAPDLTTESGTMTAAHARHDLWAGLHEADGLWIYSFAYRELGLAEAWDEYVRGMYLIKTAMRPYLAGAAKSKPTLTFPAPAPPQITVAGDYYLTLAPVYEKQELAMPESPDEYAVFNQTLFRAGDTGYMIVTHSWDQADVDFEVEFPDCIDSAAVVIGSGANLSTLGDTLSDTIDGIDGRVYRLEFKKCP